MKKLLILLLLISSEAQAVILGGHGASGLTEQEIKFRTLDLINAFELALVVSSFVLAFLLMEKLIIKIKSK